MWQHVHDGVYLIGPGPMSWAQRMLAACLAGGDTVGGSHRGGAAVWELDGFREGIVEVTVPHGTALVARGAVVHRTRRRLDGDIVVRRSIPVHCVERVLCEVGRSVPPAVVEKATEDAFRRGLTSETRLWRYLEMGGIWLSGAKRLRAVLLLRTPGRAAGSPAEVDFLRCLRHVDVPSPVRQYEIRLPGSVAVVDFAWPPQRLVAEIDGAKFHTGRRARLYDEERQSAVESAGWRVCRFTASEVRSYPRRVAETVAALVGEKSRA
ncbi:MAG TPA: DUF559 domain-containing protein [Acidimicrobiales bacterium]|nr:DUF559 domain-containing protein [Acidimicrobiales bacterium]